MWLVTGVAGFIGSHLAATLVERGETVRGVDDLSTGLDSNLRFLEEASAKAPGVFEFQSVDLRDEAGCDLACEGVSGVLHQAAVGSVPRSIADPLRSHSANSTGFANLLRAATQAKVTRMVYASSSSVYGDAVLERSVEGSEGNVLSPYAATKRSNEIYAAAWENAYGLKCVGLRYFNVFGPRQSPDGAYAAVIPRWFDLMMRGERCVIYGEGETSRDFCFVDNVVRANLLAAETPVIERRAAVYNIACGETTSLLQLHALMAEALIELKPGLVVAPPIHEPERKGDIRRSCADFSRAQTELGYSPEVRVPEGIRLAARAYLDALG